jgi:hypothetical protein
MTIQDRVENLEKQNKNLKRWMAGIGAIALAAFVGGTVISVRAYTATIEPLGVVTRDILLKDANGQVRVAISGSAGQITLYDAGAKTRVWMDSAGGTITSNNTYGTAQTTINPAGVTARNVYALDDSGRQRVHLYGNPGQVYVRDDAGKQRAALSQYGVTTRDANEVMRTYLYNATGKLMLYNSSGQVVATYP